jgi:RNA polymerase sigma-70 factor, ECF subfamily
MGIQPQDEREEELRLARAAAAGSEPALAALYARLGDPSFAYIFHCLDGNRQDAEDIWQETWMAALRGLPAFRGESRLFTWLCGIARHKIMDYRRRRSQPWAMAEDLSGQELATRIDGGVLPEEMLAQAEVRARVVQALGLLPDDYRLALAWRYADGYGVDEVARRIGRSYKAAESLLARARAAFRDALKGVYE